MEPCILVSACVMLSSKIYFTNVYIWKLKCFPFFMHWLIEWLNRWFIDWDPCIPFYTTDLPLFISRWVKNMAEAIYPYIHVSIFFAVSVTIHFITWYDISWSTFLPSWPTNISHHRSVRPTSLIRANNTLNKKWLIFLIWPWMSS